MVSKKRKSGDPGNLGAEAASVTLSKGWSGYVALRGSNGQRYEPGHWRRALVKTDKLCDAPETVIKRHDGRTVVCKDLDIGGESVKVVIKSQRKKPNFKNLCRSILMPQGLRAFKMAQKLCSEGISTAWPLAALKKKQGAVTIENIFITEYIPDSMNLYHFVREKISQQPSKDQFALKKSISEQIANILAAMHNAGLWHRDAKAGNFLVRKTEDDSFRILLVDMDGIKPYRFKRHESRYRSLAKLASTLIWHGGVSRTDYLRTFRIYCELTGLPRSRSKEPFRDIANQAIAIRLMTMANEAIKE